MDKKELAGACLTFLIVIAVAFGAYRWGHHDGFSRGSVTVTCIEATPFFVGSDKLDQRMRLDCRPNSPVRIEGGGIIMLP